MIKTPYQHADETYHANRAWDKGQRWIKTSDRFDKMEFLRESSSSDFLNNKLVDEMVNWMGEDDFNEFFKNLCRNWDIKTPPEMEHLMSWK